MMKDLIIIILLIICLVMGGILLNNRSSSNYNNTAKIPNQIAAKAGELGRTALVNIAEIEGISLQTSPEKAKEILEKNNYKCELNSNIINCKHRKLKDTYVTVTINKNSNKITKISRNGTIAKNMIAANLDYFDELRSKLNTREEVSFSQENDRTVFIVKEKKDNNLFRLSYHIQINNYPDEDGKIKEEIIYNAALSK